MKRLATLDPAWRAAAERLCRRKTEEANAHCRRLAQETGDARLGQPLMPCVDRGQVCGACEREALKQFEAQP